MPVDPAAVSLDPSSPNPGLLQHPCWPVQSSAHTWGIVEAACEQAREDKGLERLLGIERLEQLVSVWVADSPHRAHEQEPEASLDAAAGLGREVSERDRRIGVRKRLGHQLAAIEIEASYALDAVVDRLERLEDRARSVAQLWISPPGTTAYSPKNRHQPSDDAGA
jgi:hypothetical protein